MAFKMFLILFWESLTTVLQACYDKFMDLCLPDWLSDSHMNHSENHFYKPRLFDANHSVFVCISPTHKHIDNAVL